MMKTYSAKPGEVEREWLLVDAAGRPLGRVAARVASLLRGKHKAEFTPHVDTGDHVVVINAGKVLLTGNKASQKMHYRHSGYPGGLKARPYGEIRQKNPAALIRMAVKGMLPRTSLGAAMLRKLKVYAGPEHPHAAQQPRPVAPTARAGKAAGEGGKS
jgi:large subunit ribosomal protein L13